jgi:hypothetical protein
MSNFTTLVPVSPVCLAVALLAPLGPCEAEIAASAVLAIEQIAVTPSAGVRLGRPVAESAAAASLASADSGAADAVLLSPGAGGGPLACRGPDCGAVLSRGAFTLDLLHDPDASGPLPGSGGREGSGDESVPARHFTLADARVGSLAFAERAAHASVGCGLSIPGAASDAATAGASNAIDGSLSIGPLGGTLGIAFNADPRLEVFTGWEDSHPPTISRASLALEITVIDGSGSIVFSWTPGTGRDPLGGTLLMDEASLNTSRTADRNGTWYRYQPALGQGGDCGADGVCSYAAVTHWLPPGEYALSVRVSTSSSGRQGPGGATATATGA